MITFSGECGRRGIRLNVFALILTVSGCVTPPKLDPQQPTIAAERLGLSPVKYAAAAGQGWWEAFRDRQLDGLMQQALADNPTLAQAMARVREAQSLADVTHAGLAPPLSFNARDTRQRFSGDDVIPPPYAGTTRWEGREGVDL